MKKFLFLLLILLVLANSYVSYTLYKANSADEEIGSNLIFGDLINNATTTSSDPIPVEILAANSGRLYARICNNSDTKIWLTLGATSTEDDLIDINQGIQLNTVGLYGSCWEINPFNLYLGGIYASSTASAKEIVYVEK